MMRFFSFIFSCLLWQATMAQTILVNDNFADRSKFIDNTLLTAWGSTGTPATGFDLVSKTDNFSLTYNSLVLNSSALSHTGYVAPNSLKTLSSIDYEFPIIDRNVNDIKIECDALWSAMDGSGENGRLVLTLMSDYPAGGATWGQVDDTLLVNPFGKPLYNIRLRNKTGSTNTSLMLYGAGLSNDPEWEIYKNVSPSYGWWLPGFSVQSGGGSPGSGPDYPLSGTIQADAAMASATRWKHFTWIIKKERMEVYQRNSNQPESANTLAFFMEIPSTSDPVAALAQINTAHGTSATQLPPYYAWHNNPNAVRFYFRGASNVVSWLANVTITQLPQSVLSGPNPQLAATTVAGSAIYVKGSYDHNSNLRKLRIEKSVDGNRFHTLYETGASQSTVISHTDRQPQPGNNHYRLAIVNAAGETAYSKIVTVKNNRLAQPQVFYDGSQQRLQVRLPAPGPVRLRLYSATGALVQEAQLNDYIETVATGPLVKGVYYYSFETPTARWSGKILVD